MLVDVAIVARSDSPKLVIIEKLTCYSTVTYLSYIGYLLVKMLPISKSYCRQIV